MNINLSKIKIRNKILLWMIFQLHPFKTAIKKILAILKGKMKHHLHFVLVLPIKNIPMIYLDQKWKIAKKEIVEVLKKYK